MYKEVWKLKIELGSTARAMHDQHAVNSARMRLTASIKSGKYVCAYKVRLTTRVYGIIAMPVDYTKHSKSYNLLVKLKHKFKSR